MAEEHAEKKNVGGRPKERVEDKVDFDYVFRLCAAGLTDKQLAEVFNVSEVTINNWKKSEGFSLVLKKGKEVANAAVERSLWERAVGYSHPAVKIMQYEGQVIEQPYTEHFAPDPTSMIFWLKNRDSKRWKDKQDIAVTGFEEFLSQVRNGEQK